jgi:hypothetical protein
MRTNPVWKICVIFLFVSFNSYGKSGKIATSIAINSSSSKLVNRHTKKPLTTTTVTVNMTTSSTLHVVDVGITQVGSSSTSSFYFTSTSTQNFAGYNVASAYNVTVLVQSQRCHVTLNGVTQDTSPGGHPTATFNNVTSAPFNVSVVAF